MRRTLACEDSFLVLREIEEGRGRGGGEEFFSSVSVAIS